MLKRSISLLALLFCMVPMLAFAGTITTRVMTAGGSVALNGVAQTSANGTVTKSYSVPATVVITPATGYALSAVTVNNLPPPTPFILPVQKATQTLLVNFVKISTSVTSAVTGSGSVLPAGTQNLNANTTAQYVFVPTTGQNLNSITTLPAGAMLTDANLGGVVTLPAAPSVAVKVTFTVPSTGSVSMTGAFSNPVATPTLSAGAPQTIVANTVATLNGSFAGAPNGTTFAWTSTSGPAVNLSAATTLTPSVTFPTVGNYGLTLTAYNGLDAKSNPIVIGTAYTSVNAMASVSAIGQALCEDCHSSAGVGAGVYAKWSKSIHANSTESVCSGCHVGTATGAHPGTVNYASVGFTTFTTLVPGVNGLAKGAVMCTTCHITIPHSTKLIAGNTCSQCHTNPDGSGVGGTGDAHNIQGLSCVGCHAVGQSNAFSDKTLVNDNSGVRAVVGEFSKWSHHIVNAPGVALQDEQCAVCHLEGTVGKYGFSVDGTKHMTDGVIHLRNVKDDTEFAWDPANPNHTNMDNFCMTCHSATGATSAISVKLQNLITPLTGITASATNPFGDTISNKYDKMMRPAVTNVNDQFNTTNNSHHGVKGPRYTGRTRVAGSRQIANPGAFANNSSQTLQGLRSTIYDAGNFNQSYTPLANAGGETGPRTGAAALGDDSTLHCGDCHTVGQWKPGSATNAAGFNTYSTAAGRNVTLQPAIGAHGSNNEYMLRNTLGSDVRHTQNAFVLASNNTVTYNNPNGAFLVCYNCHAYKNYGSIYVGTGLDNGTADGFSGQPHAGEYDQSGRCNGIGNTIPFNGYTTGKASDGTQFRVRIFGSIPANAAMATYGGEQNTDFGNIFGIQCLNCHNSGVGNAYGGIHGSANNTSWNNGTTTITPASLGAPASGGYYIDGMGNANKNERFLPGLGDAMHVPGTLGGFTGGSTVAFHKFSSNGIDTGRTLYTYTTGGISNDTNWEQKHWQQTATTFLNGVTGVVTGNVSAGAGCYTLGTGAQTVTLDVTAGLVAPSVTGPTGSQVAPVGTWGGCNDHTAPQGGGNHGFVKRIIRPTTY